VFYLPKYAPERNPDEYLNPTFRDRGAEFSGELTPKDVRKRGEEGIAAPLVVRNAFQCSGGFSGHKPT